MVYRDLFLGFNDQILVELEIIYLFNIMVFKNGLDMIDLIENGVVFVLVVDLLVMLVILFLLFVMINNSEVQIVVFFKEDEVLFLES